MFVPVVSFTGRAPLLLDFSSSLLVRPGVLICCGVLWHTAASLVGLVLVSVEPRFYPSGCGGHKNLENVATFSKFLGREEKPRLRALFGDVSALPV